MSDGETTAELSPEEQEWKNKQPELEKQIERIKANLEAAANIRGAAPYVLTSILRRNKEENPDK